MSDYVEQGYSENYVEGDSSLSSTVNCDFVGVLNELSLIKEQNNSLSSKLDNLLSVLDSQNSEIQLLKDKNSEILTKVVSNNTLNLSLNDKVVSLDSKIDMIPTSEIDISNLVTTDYIDNKVPFVDDKSLRIFSQGTEVIVGGLDGTYFVESSRFLPNGDWDYTVVYTVSREIDGKKYFSDFAASYLRLLDLDVWMLKSECPENSE